MKNLLYKIFTITLSLSVMSSYVHANEKKVDVAYVGCKSSLDVFEGKAYEYIHVFGGYISFIDANLKKHTFDIKDCYSINPAYSKENPSPELKAWIDGKGEREQREVELRKERERKEAQNAIERQKSLDEQIAKLNKVRLEEEARIAAEERAERANAPKELPEDALRVKGTHYISCERVGSGFVSNLRYIDDSKMRVGYSFNSEHGARDYPTLHTSNVNSCILDAVPELSKVTCVFDGVEFSGVTEIHYKRTRMFMILGEDKMRKYAKGECTFEPVDEVQASELVKAEAKKIESNWIKGRRYLVCQREGESKYNAVKGNLYVYYNKLNGVSVVEDNVMKRDHYYNDGDCE